jgi:putative sulfotransferase
MIRLHPRILSVSEWFTVLGESRATEDLTADAETFWRLLTVPTQECMDLVDQYPDLPELREWRLAPANVGSRSTAPILLISLPHLAQDPDDALRDLREHILSQDARSLSEWHAIAFRFLARRQGKEIWLERSGGSLAYVDSLHRSWRDARYIHLYRDGVACVRSMYHHPYFRVRVARALSRARLSLVECLKMNIPIEQFGAYWSAVILRGLSVLRRLPREDVLHLNYERLLADPGRVLRRVQRFLEGPVEADEWVERAKVCIRANPSTTYEPPSIERLRRACRVGMSELARIETELAS